MNTFTQQALVVLVRIAEDPNSKMELRLEAAKVIVNRPRHFLDTSIETEET